jgi:hypothetical protein
VPSNLVPQWCAEASKFFAAGTVNIKLYLRDTGHDTLPRVHRFGKPLTTDHKIFNGNDEGAANTIIITSLETYSIRHGPSGYVKWRMKQFKETNAVANTHAHAPDPSWNSLIADKYRAVYVDESHYVKKPWSKYNRALQWINSRWTMLISATILHYSVSDLAGQLLLITKPELEARAAKLTARSDPFKLGEDEDAAQLCFTKGAFCTFVSENEDISEVEQGERLRRIFAKCLVRRTYETACPPGSDRRIGAGLKPCITRVVQTQLSTAQHQLYKAIAAYWSRHLIQPEKATLPGQPPRLVMNSKSYRNMTLMASMPVLAYFADCMHKRATDIKATDKDLLRAILLAIHKHDGIFDFRKEKPDDATGETNMATDDAEAEGKADKDLITVRPGVQWFMHGEMPRTDKEILAFFIRSSPKLQVLVAGLADQVIKRKEKAIIWVLFPFMQIFLQAILRLLRIDAVAFLSTMSPKSRRDTVEAFNKSDDRCEVLICNYTSNSCGLNLQHKCHNVYIFDNSPSASAWHQAIGRTFRAGQPHTVYVCEVTTENTFSGYVLDKHIVKAIPGIVAFLNPDALTASTELDSREQAIEARALKGWHIHPITNELIHSGSAEFAECANIVGTELEPKEVIIHLMHDRRGQVVTQHGGVGARFTANKGQHTPDIDVDIDMPV